VARKKLVELDIIRAFAIILIVLCHLHLFINIGRYQYLFDNVSGYVAFTGLSLFFFISGFGLHYNEVNPLNLKEISRFYLKRLVRIYPLYLIGLVASVAINIYQTGMILGIDGDKNNLLICILGLQGLLFVDNAGIIYWFIGVILLYYTIYPFLVYSRTLSGIIKNSVIILSVFIFIRYFFGLIHINFFQYYTLFILGIVMSNTIKLNYSNYNNYFKLILISNLAVLPILIVTHYYIYPQDHVIISTICLSIAASFSTLVIYHGVISYCHLLSDNIFQILSCISFGSYATYLFHLYILSILSAALKLHNVSMLYSGIIIVIILPFIFLIGYYIAVYESKYIGRKALLSDK
jgi:peptidoglycan/LPS O-acetylase OafA/YrhL